MKCTREWEERNPCKACIPMRLGGDEIVICFVMAPDAADGTNLTLERELLDQIREEVCEALERQFKFADLVPPPLDKRTARQLEAIGPSISIGVSSWIECGPGKELELFEAYKDGAESMLKYLKEHKQAASGGVRFDFSTMKETRTVLCGPEEEEAIFNAYKNKFAEEQKEVTRKRGGGVRYRDDVLQQATQDVVYHIRILEAAASHMGAKENAAATLSNLALNADNEVAIPAAGGIAPLVKLLTEGSAVAKEKAAGALSNLAGNADNEVAILAAGGIAPLVKLLTEGSAVAKEDAAGALRSLARNADNKEAIAAAGITF
jgi:hypothetical protein